MTDEDIRKLYRKAKAAQRKNRHPDEISYPWFNLVEAEELPDESE